MDIKLHYAHLQINSGRFIGMVTLQGSIYAHILREQHRCAF